MHLLQAQPDHQLGSPGRTQATRARRTSAGRPSVLIVENDALTCDVIEYVVQTAYPNCQTRLAVCLRDASALLDSQPFDLIIADLGLPDSRGIETAASLRGKSSCNIMLYSAALNDPHVMQEAQQAGFEHCIPKSASSRGAVRQCISALLAAPQ